MVACLLAKFPELTKTHSELLNSTVTAGAVSCSDIITSSTETELRGNKVEKETVTIRLFILHANYTMDEVKTLE